MKKDYRAQSDILSRNELETWDIRETKKRHEEPITDQQFTLVGYANRNGLTVEDLNELISAICIVAEAYNFIPSKMHDEGWASLYLYPEWLLEMAFALAGYEMH